MITGVLKSCFFKDGALQDRVELAVAFVDCLGGPGRRMGARRPRRRKELDDG
jgi:hypothetical protein